MVGSLTVISLFKYTSGLFSIIRLYNTQVVCCIIHKWFVLQLSLGCLNTQVVGSLTVISLFKYTSGWFSIIRLYNTQVVGSLTILSLFKYTSGWFSYYH